ncbi:MAG TPA: extracellular solute-binding protein [Solirubrobacteraceae bacterium]|jgi:iron(III) transport system substrate-binding protein|nr:extracellular solute-binding protein [Solirubrobacteraceae bacterium]
MTRGRRWLAGVAGALALAAALAGCGGSGGSSILLYNGQHPQVTAELVSAFEKQTGIKVEVRTNDGIVLADQILQEGGASPADVYLTENSPELENLEQHGLLARLEASTLAQVPSRYESQRGEWAGMALRISALAYDPSLVSSSRLPKSLLELGEPRWRGRVALAPTDSDFVPLVGAVIAAYGKATAVRWLAGLKRNGALYQSDESVVSAVNDGSVAVGIINHYYWYRLRLEVGAAGMHSRLYFFPNRNVGSLENISGAAVLKTSAHMREAQEFVRFLLGPTAQGILARGYDFEYPTRPGVAPNPQVTPLSRIAPATLSPKTLGNDEQAAALVQESGLA